MTLEELIASARAHGFSDIAALKRLARSALVLLPVKHETDPARSRFGGLPDLPSSIAWPRHDGRSLAFVAQIELSSQPRLPAREGFPQDGRLLFFCDTEQDTWGLDPNDAGRFAVIYVPGPPVGSDSNVGEWPLDLPDAARYRACPLASEPMMTLPPWESVLIDELGLDEEQYSVYMDVLQALSGDAWARRAVLGGYPDQVQGDIGLVCSLVSAGVDLADEEVAEQHATKPETKRRASEWRLLLQVPSEASVGMMWGDLGCLYYLIREEDLVARRFDRAWISLQC